MYFSTAALAIFNKLEQIRRQILPYKQKMVRPKMERIRFLRLRQQRGWRTFNEPDFEK